MSTAMAALTNSVLAVFAAVVNVVFQTPNFPIPLPFP